jgi:hypothetical protein
MIDWLALHEKMEEQYLAAITSGDYQIKSVSADGVSITKDIESFKKEMEFIGAKAAKQNGWIQFRHINDRDIG